MLHQTIYSFVFYTLVKNTNNKHKWVNILRVVKQTINVLRFFWWRRVEWLRTRHQHVEMHVLEALNIEVRQLDVLHECGDSFMLPMWTIDWGYDRWTWWVAFVTRVCSGKPCMDHGFEVSLVDSFLHSKIDLNDWDSLRLKARSQLGLA